MLRRTSGILCHPTSLPSAYGIGDLGSGADQYIAFLVESGQSAWQVLPLGPTGYGDSPYQPFSAFAGNPLLISPELLAVEGLLFRDELSTAVRPLADHIDYGQVISSKTTLLRQAFRRFLENPARRGELDDFRAANSDWLEDYALFMALKLHFDWAMWTDWPLEIALRKTDALAFWRRELAEEVSYQAFVQLQFARQWSRVRDTANRAGIRLIGDMPIFVGQDSADVWANRELFQLDERGRPTVVAGVPPDYFSPTGQLWGNPLYDWQRLRATGYQWWIHRLRHILRQVDQVRLDHFRGFSGYWQVPAGEATAINGRWVRGPGSTFFTAVRGVLGELPIIAEDLGLISADVVALRQELGLPGMRVLQFAFDSDPANEHLPHNWERDLVAYTGTHDNDTTIGWYYQLAPEVKARVDDYLGANEPVNWALIRLAMNSVAGTVIVPLQDVLGCGSECRLNSPGRPYGNWTWRFRAEALQPGLAERLKRITYLSGRYTEPGSEPLVNEPVVLEYDEE